MIKKWYLKSNCMGMILYSLNSWQKLEFEGFLSIAHIDFFDKPALDLMKSYVPRILAHEVSVGE